MAAPHVFVTRQIPEPGLRRLRERCKVDVWEGALPPGRDELLARARPAAGLLTMLSDGIDSDLIAACPDLRVVANYAVGYDNVDLAAARERGIAVGNTPGVLTDATADLALTLLLGAARRVVEASANAREGRWRTWEPVGFVGADLVGRTLGIVGLGRIGSAVARRCHFGWGMRVLHTSRTPKPELERELSAEQVELDRLLAESDVVSLHAPLMQETEHLIDADALARMKPGAILVNTARGGLVDQPALVDALRSGRLRAAGLDVTDPEPPAPDDPLLHLPNCLVLPHIGSATDETRDRMSVMAADNVLAGLAGEPLPYSVT